MTAGERRAATRWGGAELHHRWRSFLAVGLLFGLTGAVSAACVAGARRADTAYERFHEAADGGDAIVFGIVSDPDWSAIVELPEVETAAAYAPFEHRVGLAEDPERDTGIWPMTPAEPDGLFTAMEVPQLTSGRQVERADEVVIGTQAHRELGIELGDVVVVETKTPASDDPDVFDGPKLPLQVVGIGQTPIGLTLFGGELVAFTSPDLLGGHEEIPRGSDLVVQLRHGAADLPALRTAARDAFGTDVQIVDLAESSGRIAHGTTFERNGLLLLAAGAGAVGLLVAAQALSRSVAAGGDAVPALRALGLPRPARALALAVPTVVTAASAVAVMLVLSILLSPQLPVGLARRLEVDRGVHADGSALGGAALVLLLTVAAATAFAAWRTAGGGRPDAAGSAGRAPRAARWPARLPLAAEIGARFALEPSDRSWRSPLRPVVLGAALGLAGVVATAVVAAGLDDALSSPARSGQHWEAMYVVNDPPAFEEELSARDDVLGVAHASFADVSAEGITFSVFAIEPVTGPRSLTVRTGRAPAQPDEIVLGVATARRLHVGAGDSIDLRTESDRATLRVVGTGLALQTPSSAYDEGAWVTPQGMERVGDLSLFGEAAPAVLVDFDDTVPSAEVERYASPRQGELFNNLENEAQVVTNLRSVRWLPWLEGAFFVLLTLGSIAQLLWTTSRRRRDDLALLRALGFTRRQTSGAVTSQGITVGVVGIVIGVPLGLVVGAWVWRSMAGAVSLVDVGPLPVTFLVLVVPITVLAGAGLGFASAQRTARHLRVRPVLEEI